MNLVAQIEQEVGEGRETVIKRSRFLQQAYFRGRKAGVKLLNGGREDGAELVLDIGGQPTDLSKTNREYSAGSYAQMLALHQNKMKENGEIRGMATSCCDVDAVTAQALGFFDEVSRSCDFGDATTLKSLRDIICGE